MLQRHPSEKGIIWHAVSRINKLHVGHSQSFLSPFFWSFCFDSFFGYIFYWGLLCWISIFSSAFSLLQCCWLNRMFLMVCFYPCFFVLYLYWFIFWLVFGSCLSRKVLSWTTFWNGFSVSAHIFLGENEHYQLSCVSFHTLPCLNFFPLLKVIPQISTAQK